MKLKKLSIAFIWTVTCQYFIRRPELKIISYEKTDQDAFISIVIH